MQQGYIKLYRSLLNWEWYKNIPVRILFEHCLLKANHKDNKWQGKIIKKGSFVTSLDNLAFETGLTKMQVRTALNKLKLTHEITHEGHSQYSIISIKNWYQYQQDNTQDNTRITHEQHTDNTRITLNKNEKNEKNEKNIFVIPKIEEIKNYCKERNNKINPLQFYDYYQSKGWYVGRNKMKDWKAAVRTWEQKDKTKPPKTPYTEYNPGC
jgi:hypothetical protein